MNRRTFVALLGAVAGCSSVPSPENSIGTSSPEPAPSAVNLTNMTETPATVTPVRTATEQPTATEEPPATETETPTPSPAERRAATALERAETKLTDVVDTFTAEYGSELTAVEAASVGFLDLDYELQLAFADAQDAYTTAQNRAVTDEQQQRAAHMEGCWQFLQGARKTQAEVVEGYVRLASARDAFERVQPSPARDAIDELNTYRRRATTDYERLQSSSTVEAAAVIGAISTTEYQDKLAQFDADTTVYRDLEDPLDRFAEGIKWLRLAKLEYEKDNRNVQKAEDKAETAESILYGVGGQLNGVVNSAPDATTLMPMLKDLRKLANTKARVAGDLDL